MSQQLVIDEWGGTAPVQGTGTYGGYPWYFRARHWDWSFSLAEPGRDPVGAHDAIFELWSRYGTGRTHSASHMELDRARAAIELACSVFDTTHSYELIDQVMDAQRQEAE